MTRASVVPLLSFKLQPVCSHLVFTFGKEDGDEIKELIEVLRLGAVYRAECHPQMSDILGIMTLIKFLSTADKCNINS